MLVEACYHKMIARILHGRHKQSKSRDNQTAVPNHCMGSRTGEHELTSVKADNIGLVCRWMILHAGHNMGRVRAYGWGFMGLPERGNMPVVGRL